MTERSKWWKKHIEFKSDNIVKMVEDSPEQFLISRTEILQLVLDFKTLKNRFVNLCLWQQAQDEWIDLPQEEKDRQRKEYEETERMIREMFDNYDPPKT